MVDDFLYVPEVDEEQHIIATYYVESRKLIAAVEAIAIGQSIGNPSVRLERETDDLLSHNLAKILDLKTNLEGKLSATVRVAFPLENIDLHGDGITQLLAMLMGGQMDIDIIEVCRLLHVRYPTAMHRVMKGPRVGMDEIKRRTGAVNRPLVGSIVKPKTGMSPEDLKKVCLELVRGGVDFIKEDEILGNPVCCPFEARVGLVAAAVREEAAKQKREVFYAPCINGDYPSFLHKARRAVELGATAVHLNIWAGLPAYRALRDLDLNVAIFFQKSGDKVITCGRHNYAIAWPVVTQLARMMGVDFIHAGMWGGYLSDPKDFLDAVLMTLRARGPFKRTVPSFSCGSHPGLAPTTVKHFGSDLMMSSGAGIHGHPDGTTAGAMAMRQAVELAMEGGDFLAKAKTRPELRRAIEKWGCVDE